MKNKEEIQEKIIKLNNIRSRVRLNENNIIDVVASQTHKVIISVLEWVLK